jgi:hypothetical protein
MVTTGNWLLTPLHRWRDRRLSTRVHDNLMLAATMAAAGKEEAAKMLREHADRLKAAMHRPETRPRIKNLA